MQTDTWLLVDVSVCHHHHRHHRHHHHNILTRRTSKNQALYPFIYTSINLTKFNNVLKALKTTKTKQRKKTLLQHYYSTTYRCSIGHQTHAKYNFKLSTSKCGMNGRCNKSPPPSVCRALGSSVAAAHNWCSRQQCWAR